MRYTLKRDDIQPEGLMICAALRASMIYQTCGLDKKSRIKMIRLFWCGRQDSNLHGCPLVPKTSVSAIPPRPRLTAEGSAVCKIYEFALA